MILDLSKVTHVEIEFKSKSGDTFLRKGVITAELIDLQTKLTNEKRKMFAKVDSKSKDFTIDLNGEAKKELEIKQEVIKAFMGEQYDEYLSASRGFEATVNQYTYAIIQQEMLKYLENKPTEESEKIQPI